jgi:hypothetical protein
VTVTGLQGDVQGNLRFAATRDGDGAWQVAEGTGGVYLLGITTGRFGFAWVCESAWGAALRAVHASTSEMVSLTAACGVGPRRSITGAVTGLAEGERGRIAVGTGYSTIYSFNTSYEVMTYENPADLVAMRFLSDLSLASLTRVNDVAESTADIDFSAGVAPVSLDFAMNGVTADDYVTVTSSLQTRLGTVAQLGQSGLGDPSLLIAPGEILRADDTHLITARAIRPHDAGEPVREHRHWERLPSSTTIDLPPYLAMPTFAATRTSYAIADVTIAPPPGVIFYTLLGVPQTSAVLVAQNLQYSAAWLGSADAVHLVTPALAALPGWNAAWTDSGAWLSLTVMATWSSLPVATLIAGGLPSDTTILEGSYVDESAITGGVAP